MKNLNSFLDYTLLTPTTTIAEIEKACNEAIQNQFAAVCVPPLFAKKCKALLQGTTIKVATAIGFPLGYSAIEAKLAEIVLAIVDGADELDIVINTMAIKNNDWQYVANEINHILPVVKERKRTIKIIMETSLLTVDEIKKCCDLYGAAGIDFMQTSTGYSGDVATKEVVALLKKNLPASVQVKAMGGISTIALAEDLINAGATRVGCSKLLER